MSDAQRGSNGRDDDRNDDRNDDRGGTGAAQDRPDEQGQVSEVGSLDPAAADTPISDDQAVAGYPDSESGRPDEGEAGPDAVPADNIRDVEGKTTAGNDHDR